MTSEKELVESIQKKIIAHGRQDFRKHLTQEEWDHINKALKYNANSGVEKLLIALRLKKG